ncbi:transient receptor potential channel pyrexia-like [Choristoneura fumiferana]|uniref:transient receptor potential channel pyrexia-like n=1 Tax=Choristoneura fumiferana TaxID=7141 RepID=UPI003D15BBCC
MVLPSVDAGPAMDAEERMLLQPVGAPEPRTLLTRSQFFIEDENKALAAQQEMHDGASGVPLGLGGDMPAHYQEMSPIHIALESGDMDKFEKALKDAERDQTLDKVNGRGDTPLGTAILKSNLPAIQALLIKGATPNRVSDKNESALHKAVHDPKILKYFLDNTYVPSTFNSKGLAPIHAAVCARNPASVKLLLEKFKYAPQNTVYEGHTPLHFAAIEASNDAAEVILEHNPEAVFEVNKLGDTPLHAAARHNNRGLATLLLRKGAVLSTRNKNEVTILELISNNFYDATNFFYQVFDEFIYRKPLKNNDLDFEIDVDYRVLTNGKNDMSHMKVLDEFVGCGQSKVLIHPLIESLLYLKWIHFLPLFYAMILVYAVFLASFNIFVISVFQNEDLMNSGSSTSTAMNVSSTGHSDLASGDETPDSGLHAGVYWLLIALIYISTLILLVQECFFIYLKKRRYFASWESWVKMCGLVLCAGTPPLAALSPGPWPRHVACASLLLAWVQAMFLISRFPRYGFYILMFGKVAVEILKILVTVLLLVIGFSFCFMIQYHSAPPFDGPFAAFVKTLVMMSSEFDYEGLFGEDHAEQLRGTSMFVRVLFLAFVIFVAIVLMNFMIGLAVSDINELNRTGNIRRLEKQVELLSTFDSLVYDGILSKWFQNTFVNKRYPLSMSTVTRRQSIWKVKYNNEKPSSVKIRSATLYYAIVEAASKNDQRMNKNDNVMNICTCKTEKLIGAAGMSQPTGSNTNWLHEVINKQNEQIKTLLNQLAMTSHENNGVKRSINNLNKKIDYLLKSQTK